MKFYKIFTCVCILLISIGQGQTLYTFSNTTSTSIAAAGSATFNVVVSGVPTTGMVLRQVNIGFGNTASMNSGNVASITMRLKDVLGTLSTMLSPTSFAGATGDFRLFDIHLRDDNVLKTPEAQKAATSSVLSKGYPFHYGYYKPEGNFSSFNTTSSVNGIWQFVVNNGAGGARIFTKVELVFGPAITAIDIRTTKPNQSCSTKQCIDGTTVYYATNNGYPTNQTVTPPNTVGGCAWNGQKDNNNWFFFRASGSTAYVSISGFSSVQESSVFTVSSCASSATYGIVAGGCGPTDMFSSTVNSQKYYATSSGATYAGGYAWNHGYYLTGLVTGNDYVFVIDGSSAAVSNFYVEITGSAQSCSIVLPIELLYFKGEKVNDKNLLNWATASEINNSSFEIEKSTDGINFSKLTSINSKSYNGQSKQQLNYNYEDVACTAYYRLKQTDFNGQYKYHNTIFIENKESDNTPIVMPNPAHEQLVITFRTKLKQKTSIILYDISGRSVLSREFVPDSENNKFILDIEHLNPGLYFLTTNDGFKSHQQKIIKE